MSMKVNCNGNFLNFDLSNPNCSHDRQVFEALIAGINSYRILDAFFPESNLITSQKPKEMTKYSKRRLLEKTREGFSDEHNLTSYSCWRALVSELSAYWANDVEVRKALHVKEGTTRNWVRCNRHLPYDYNVKSSVVYHRNISTKGYKNLILSGDHDMTVAHITIESWIRSLDNLSLIDEWRPWFVNGQIAGYTMAYSNGLTYATIKGCGHDASGDKPKECYAMFERWISNSSL
ncbi:hypothetical protein MKW92_016679 [Papaver armeniacum]|nr:hypothetical protein MKW92_016679 [Papaver armeniacum]